MKRDRWNYHSNSLQWRLGAIARGAALLLLLFMLLLVCSFWAPLAHGQSLKVKEFAGATVGAKTTAAQAACQAGLTCVLSFEPELGPFPIGTMPARCALCTWLDYRIPGAGPNYPYSIGTSPQAVLSSTSFGPQAVANIGDGGRYRIFYYAWQNAPCTTGSNSVTFQFAFTDVASRTVNTVPMTLDSTAGLANVLAGVIPFRTVGGSVTVAATVSGTCTTGSSQFAVDAYVERIPYQ